MPSASSPAESVAGAEPASERRATWLELFFDLVFAAAVGEVGALLGEHYGLGGLLAFAFPFWLIWWAWAGHTAFSTRFDSDAFGQRLLTVGQMFLVAVMAANTTEDLGSRESAGFAAAYGGLRLLLALQYLRVRDPASRPFRRAHAAGIGLAAAIWVLSGTAPDGLRVALWLVALTVDVLTPVVASRVGPHHPPDPSHLPERFGLFTLIMLGEALIGTMAGMKRQETWTAAAAGSAGLGLATTFAIWWAYFDVVRGAAPRPVSVGDRRRLRAWLVAHLPLNFGLVVAGVGVEHVVAHGGAAPLAAPSAGLLSGALALAAVALAVIAWSQAPETPRPGRWILCGAAAIGCTGASMFLAPQVSAVWLLAALFGAGLALVVASARAGFGVRMEA